MRTSGLQLRSRRGLTLAELSVSLAVIATLMVAIGSIMLLAGRAVGMTAAQASEARIDDLVATIASEQRMALTVLERTDTSITFTVADRDGDGKPEKIQYYWSGVADAPLMRRYNEQQEVAVVAKVKQFRLSATTKTASDPATAPQTESTTDELLYAYETGTNQAHPMSQTSWPAQAVVAKLPRADATSWRVTRVQLVANKSSSASGSSKWTVSLCPSDALGAPNFLAPIEQQTIEMSKLTTTVAWTPSTQLLFSGAHNLDPTKRYWIVVSQSVIASTGNVQYVPSSTVTADPYATTITAGGSWTLHTGRDMKIRVYGRYKYPAP